jgi:hypothetical protein
MVPTFTANSTEAFAGENQQELEELCLQQYPAYHQIPSKLSLVELCLIF